MCSPVLNTAHILSLDLKKLTIEAVLSVGDSSPTLTTSEPLKMAVIRFPCVLRTFVLIYCRLLVCGTLPNNGTLGGLYLSWYAGVWRFLPSSQVAIL